MGLFSFVHILNAACSDGSHYIMTSCLEKLSEETIIFDETLGYIYGGKA